jgi:hypothetical protein
MGEIKQAAMGIWLGMKKRESNAYNFNDETSWKAVIYEIEEVEEQN